MDALFGHGIFNTNGDEWKFQRKTASQIFNVKNFRDHFTEYVAFAANLALKFATVLTVRTFFVVSLLMSLIT